MESRVSAFVTGFLLQLLLPVLLKWGRLHGVGATRRRSLQRLKKIKGVIRCLFLRKENRSFTELKRDIF
jgi:hypothetical protein